MLRRIANIAATVSGLSNAEIRNASWLIFGTLMRLSLAAAVDIAVARHLAPELFGQLRFSIATMVLFGSLHGFGLAGLATRSLVREPENRDEILGTVVVMRFVVAVSIVPLIVLTAWVSRPGDADVLIMTSILAAFATVGVFDSIDYVLQSELKSRYTVIARSINLVVTAIVKVALIFFDAPLWTFAVAYGLDFLMIAVTFSSAYLRLGYSPSKWRFSPARAKQMMVLVWPVFIAGAASTLNIRVDQVMLGALREAEDVGVYAAAARLTLIWYFVPEAIAASAFPALIRMREQDPAHYEARLRNLYSLLAWLGIAIAAVMTLASGVLVTLLYGADFEGASRVLMIQAWASPFIFMGSLFGRWLIAESRFLLTAVRHTLGVILNVIVNILLIPEYGAEGAAVASLLSFITAVYLASFLHPSTREAGFMMTRALLRGPVDIVQMARHSGR